MKAFISSQRFVFSLFALNYEASANRDPCRSNSTHLAWKTSKSIEPAAIGRRELDQNERCHFQLHQEAHQECIQYLQENLMAFDIPFRETMGFPDGNIPSVDGLNNGMIGHTVQLALEAKLSYSWTDALPKQIFFEYVLNYANLNEARTNWRPLLVDALKFNESDIWVSGEANLTSVVSWVNKHLWTVLGRNGSPIYFKSSQTPLIFDPMSTISFGYASCTGTSILFCNALRAVGIPSRVAGTPAWYGNASQGNHNWVEVLVGEHGWKFLEPSPSLPEADTLDNAPCSRWFCKPSRFPASKVYAARLTKQGSVDSTVAFPLAWEWDCQDVPGIDRTDYYTDICGLCEE